MPVDIVATEEVDVTRADLVAAALFDNSQQADVAFGLLQQSGFSVGNMSFLQRRGEVLRTLDPTAETGELLDPDDQPTAADPGTGAIEGIAVGGAAGALVGLGLVAIPVVGPFLAAGALATMFTGAVVGAVAGGLAGALLLWGAPNDVAHHYAGEMHGQRCILMVASAQPERQQMAADLLARAGGRDVRLFVRQVK